jgi:cell division protein FtsA
MRRIRTAIDIGSSETKIVVGELYDSGNSIRVLGKAVIPSNGVKKGKIIDKELFSRTIKAGKERLENEIGVDIDKATVGISGSDIKSITVHSENLISKEEDIEITEQHCNEMLEISKKKVISENEEILEKEIYNYRIDDSGIVKSPVGKKGKKIEAKVHMIKVPSERITVTIEALNKANIEVDSIIYNGKAVAKAVLKKSDKVNGVALIDIGAGLTEITIFKNNKLISTKVIPIGGNHYLSDLKQVLELEGSVVEQLLQNMRGKNIDESVNVNFLEDGKSVAKSYEVKYIKDILNARTDEILKYVLSSIEASGYKEYIRNGIVLTGGTAGNYGILKALKKQVEYDVRIGNSIVINGMTSALKKPGAMASIGLLLIALEDEYKKLKDSKFEEPKVEEEGKVEATTEEKGSKEEKENKKNVEKKITQKDDENSVMKKIKKWFDIFV